MNNDSPLKDLSDDQLAIVAGGRHSHSHGHRHSHGRSHGHQGGNTYIVNNYYVIDSTDTQIASGSSRNSSNNGTNVSLG